MSSSASPPRSVPSARCPRRRRRAGSARRCSRSRSRRLPSQRRRGDAVAALEPATTGVAADRRRQLQPRGAEDVSDLEEACSTTCSIEVLDAGASDLHLTVGRAARRSASTATLRADGRATPSSTPPVTAADGLRRSSRRSSGRSSRRSSSSTSPTRCPGKARFRVNVYQQRDAVGAAFRLIPYEIKPLEELGVPPAVAQLRRCCRAASCSSPARPVRASRRRSPSLDRPGQPHPARPHHDRRGPDRVPAPAQAVPGQPARGRRGHALLRQRAQARAAPGPRHHPGR